MGYALACVFLSLCFTIIPSKRQQITKLFLHIKFSKRFSTFHTWTGWSHGWRPKPWFTILIWNSYWRTVFSFPPIFTNHSWHLVAFLDIFHVGRQQERKWSDQMQKEWTIGKKKMYLKVGRTKNAGGRWAFPNMIHKHNPLIFELGTISV